MDKYPSLNLGRNLETTTMESETNPITFLPYKAPKKGKNDWNHDAEFVIEPRFKDQHEYSDQDDELSDDH